MSLQRITHDVQQGTGPWLRLREGFDTASEAPAALGVGKYVTRAELLRRKHTGIAEEHGPATLAKFRHGHDAEASARPIAEPIAGGELFPVTMSVEVAGLRLLASLDGQVLEGDVIWETKLWNEELAANVRAGTLPEHYTVQMDQELLVSGAERCLFTCTDGTPERFVSCWYEADPAKFEALIDGWIRFHKDLDAYTHQATADPAPVGQAPESLPALRIEVTGEVTASNLAEFKQTALAAIRSVNRDLKTDADFADAEKAVKWCGDVESRLKAAKEHALSQTASIDALFKTIDDIGAEAKRVRLDLDKLVTRRKDECKAAAVSDARAALHAHVDLLNAELAPMRLLPVTVDFAGAIKGLRSIASMQDALDTALAQGKIAADNQARGIRANVAHFQKSAVGMEFLFSDLGQLVHKAHDDFESVLASRIRKQLDAVVEQEIKRKADEQARVAAEAQRLAAEQIRQAQEAERAAQAAQQQAATAAPAPTPAPAAPAAVARPVAPIPTPADPATLKLGTICDRLGFIVRADFLADTLHIRPASKADGRPGLYTERQFAVICNQLISHVSAMAELYAGEPA